VVTPVRKATVVLVSLRWKQRRTLPEHTRYPILRSNCTGGTPVTCSYPLRLTHAHIVVLWGDCWVMRKNVRVFVTYTPRVCPFFVCYVVKDASSVFQALQYEFTCIWNTSQVRSAMKSCIFVKWNGIGVNFMIWRVNMIWSRLLLIIIIIIIIQFNSGLLMCCVNSQMANYRNSTTNKHK
jgi:hypothetical protein